LAGVVAALFMAGWLAPGSASAAPPANDNFADRENLGSGLTATASGSNVDATGEPGEPTYNNNTHIWSVWYGWTPPATGHYEIENCTSDFTAMVRGYLGPSVSSLGTVVGVANCFGSFTGGGIDGTEGQEVKLFVDTWNIVGVPKQGSFSFQIRASDDIFAAATDLGSDQTASATRHTYVYTSEPGEPAHAGSPANSSQWLRWVAPTSDRYVIDLCDSDFDTLLAVYTGDALNALTPVASNDDRCGSGGNRSKLVLQTTAGTNYRIAVDAASFGRNVDLDLYRVEHDRFADAKDLGDLSNAASTGSNVDGTKEAGEPAHGGNAGGASIWHTWTAPADGEVTIDTCDSGFDSTLGVYIGEEVGSLSTVASDDDGCRTGSAVTFVATAGTVYRIAVDGYREPESEAPELGAFSLNVNPGPQPEADGDGVSDFTDNCLGSANPSQADLDEDDAGDACDSDDDGDEVSDTGDTCPAEWGESVNGCPLRLLTINVQGSGNVAVFDSFGQFECPTDFCDVLYDDGEVISLAASPGLGSTFQSLSGGGCSGGPQCIVTLDRDQAISASFLATMPPSAKKRAKKRCKKVRGKKKRRCKKTKPVVRSLGQRL
jgi:hypothetical protein